jgi:hypothetical protein
MAKNYSIWNIKWTITSLGLLLLIGIIALILENVYLAYMFIVVMMLSPLIIMGERKRLLEGDNA